MQYFPRRASRADDLRRRRPSPKPRRPSARSRAEASDRGQSTPKTVEPTRAHADTCAPPRTRAPLVIARRSSYYNKSGSPRARRASPRGSRVAAPAPAPAGSRSPAPAAPKTGGKPVSRPAQRSDSAKLRTPTVQTSSGSSVPDSGRYWPGDCRALAALARPTQSGVVRSLSGPQGPRRGG